MADNSHADRHIDEHHYHRHLEGEKQTSEPLPTEADALTEDPDDSPRLPLAIASGADYLFTHDRSYLHEGLREHGVEVAAPDPFLAAAFDAEPQQLLAVLERQASDLASVPLRRC